MRKKKFFTKDLAFYVIMIALPVIQFCIFYIGVNTRSFMYAFQKVEVTTQGSSVSWTLDPIKNAYSTLTSARLIQYLKNTLIMFAICYLAGTSLALIFSYFIFKKLKFGNFFRLMLFLPSIISAVVLATIYMQFVEKAYPQIMFNMNGEIAKGLFENEQTRFGTLVFYNVFTAFGTNVLMYSNAMSGISTEIVEAGKLDGCNSFQEFIHIVLPGAFPTLKTFTITAVATLFVNQFNLYALFDQTGYDDLNTIGYYLYGETLRAGTNVSQYPAICAMGLILTAIAVPITFIVKGLLDKYGPSEN